MKWVYCGFFILYVFIPSHVSANQLDNFSAQNLRPPVSILRKDIEQSENIISTVKSNQPFINIQQERVWRYKNKAINSDDELQLVDELNAEPDIGWLIDFIRFLTVAIEFILWMLPFIIAIFIYRSRNYWLAFIKLKRPQVDVTVLPDTLFGLDIRGEKLPHNIESISQELWAKNCKREAVSLLYRGALVYLFKKFKFTLPSGATEQDCIRYLDHYSQTDMNSKNANFNAQQTLDRFKLITDVWISIAYAHKLPTDKVFLRLSEGWDSCFKKLVPEDHVQ